MLKKIAFWVITIHLVWVVNLMLPVKKKSAGPKKFVVQTEKLKPSSVKQGQAISQKVPSTRPKPKKQTPKKEKPPATPVKKPPAPVTLLKPKGLITQAPDKVPDKIKKEQKPVALPKQEEKKIEPPPKVEKVEEELEVPSTIGELNIEKSHPQEQETGTEDALVSYLHEALHLPEYGEVKIQLTILSDGSFVKMVVLKSESVKNEKYLESRLPLLTFPFVRGTFLGERSFIMTFCNEI